MGIFRPGNFRDSSDFRRSYVKSSGPRRQRRPEATGRVEAILLGENRQFRIISLEDLIIDRIRACVYWEHAESGIWALVMMKIGMETDEPIDLEYIRRNYRALTTGRLSTDSKNFCCPFVARRMALFPIQRSKKHEDSTVFGNKKAGERNLSFLRLAMAEEKRHPGRTDIAPEPGAKLPAL